MIERQIDSGRWWSGNKGTGKGRGQRELQVHAPVADNQVPNHNASQVLPLLGLSLNDSA
jgi:hypothetical protein